MPRSYSVAPVMPGLVPGIHESQPRSNKNVDGRDKPGDDA